ncbi:Imm50 family immunity protein [Micromonospora sp. DT48]|uniref:Imm50 family immunity protein n=1 Tax=Micromonospora sp. DT48 TaxID=3393429 RepID=UPI003CFBBA9B
MGWLDLVTNPQGLREIFGAETPPLVGVGLHGVEIDREGPTLRLRLDLPTYPSNPPVKWRRNGYNVVQVELLLGGVSDISIRGVSVNMLVDVDIKSDGRLALKISSPTLNMIAMATSVTVSKIDAYLDGGRDLWPVKDSGGGN